MLILTITNTGEEFVMAQYKDLTTTDLDLLPNMNKHSELKAMIVDEA